MYQENKILTEQRILDRLVDHQDRYRPLKIEVIGREEGAADLGYDARILIEWGGKSVRFMAEIKTRTAPMMVSDAVRRLKSFAGAKDESRLLVVPYLSKAVVEILEGQGVSGIDLNGNYRIVTPRLVAIRLDRPNEFTESQPIRRIFSGNSSLVGRLFLARRRTFTSVNEVWGEIRNGGGELSLSAVSKVLSGLEGELIVEKGRKQIRLLQADMLLRRLEEAYTPPKTMGTLKCKLPGDEVTSGQLVNMIPQGRWMFSGEASVGRYEISASSGPKTIYIAGPMLPQQTQFLRVYEENRFPTLIIKWLESSFPLFDARSKEAVLWASPVQCCLELSKLGKREQESAAGIRAAVLRDLQ